jgi:flagellar hook-length control protein FliK
MLSLGAGDFTLGNIFPESPEWAGQKWDGATNVATTTMTMATNLITHAKQAGQAHPAAQAVIATLTRGAQSGENRSFTLQLDPPELGRLEIQMQFTKDKSVKAHMIFEKPETMLMLQRDSQALERALQEAGLDAGGNELSFELATEDHRFGDDGKGSNKSAGKMDKNTTDDRVIESTMTWYVDTETGLQRYNILA